MSDATAPLALSYIAVVANFTDQQIKLTNHEDGRIELIDPMSAYRVNNLAVPWCGSQANYRAGRKLSIGSNGTVKKDHYWLTEDHGKVYGHSTDTFDGRAVVKPDSDGGRWKLLEIKPAAGGGYSIRVIDVKVN